MPAKDLQIINVLSIKYADNKWVSTLTSFLPVLPEHSFNRNDTTNYFRQQTITNLSTKNIKPDINIESVIKRLSEFDFQNAPNNAEIESGQTLSSGNTRYILEFADKRNYRVIHYLNADRNSNKIPFDDNFIKFFNFIKGHYAIEIAPHSDSNNTFPGLIKPGTISTYSIFESDTAIRPLKVSLYQLNKDYKMLHGKFIETEGKFKYGFEQVYISSNPALDNSQIAFWLNVHNTKLYIQQAFDKMSGKYIRIKGMVDTSMQGHLNGYPASITKIYFWEVKN